MRNLVVVAGSFLGYIFELLRATCAMVASYPVALKFGGMCSPRWNCFVSLRARNGNGGEIYAQLYFSLAIALVHDMHNPMVSAGIVYDECYDYYY